MRKFSLLVLAAMLVMSLAAGTAYAGKPTIGKPCVQCHRGQPDVVRGTMGARSEKFSTINVHAGNLVWVIGYDGQTGVEGAKSLEAIPRGKEIAVTFTQGEKARATVISVKQPYTVPEGQLASLGYVKSMVERGPKVGGYLLVDARPRSRYLEGHLPGAVSMPYDLFDRMHGMVLPTNRDLPVIFYCGGVTCMMSPLSALKATELGHTNLKVFQAGLASWKKDRNLVVSESAYILNIMKNDIARVLVDLRGKRAAKKGHIAGAVNIPAKKLARAKKSFPADKSAPVILYTDKGIDEAAFATVRGWGYRNASVLNNGLSGWKAGGGKLVTGKPAKKIVYKPKPIPGTITIAEFKKIVAALPADKLILDVRNHDEVANGKLAVATHIPEEELLRRMSELPKDKEIIIHCDTGVRAMMAQEALKKKGYTARYLNEVIQIAPDGSFEITK